jgi:hypothetical protein
MNNQDYKITLILFHKRCYLKLIKYLTNFQHFVHYKVKEIKNKNISIKIY